MLILLTVLTAVLFICNLLFGAISISCEDVMGIICGSYTGDDSLRYIVLESRLPQAITAMLAGGALGLCGLMLQTAFRNPLAGPSILGITSGASLGVALVLLIPGIAFSTGVLSGIATVAGAMLGSVIVMGLLLLLSARLRNNLSVLIAGILTGYLASAVVTLLSSFSTKEGIQSYVIWGMGSFGGVSYNAICWWSIAIIVGLISGILLAKPLNLLLLGDRYAANLGVNVKRVRTMLLLVTGLLCALITAYCGPIGFIGLAMPHIARMLMRDDNHFIMMPATMLCGAVTALACNVASVGMAESVIPLNALTPLVGVPVVIYVMLRGNARGESI